MLLLEKVVTWRGLEGQIEAGQAQQSGSRNRLWPESLEKTFNGQFPGRLQSNLEKWGQCDVDALGGTAPQVSLETGT